VSKIVPFATLVRQQQTSYLRHKHSENQERQDYLAELRKLAFKVEAQMRQAEFQQLEMFREMADHFKIPLNFPDLGDRVGFQDYFASNPFLTLLREYFGGRLSEEECWEKLLALQGDTPAP
jgi:hypothetical protein